MVLFQMGIGFFGHHAAPRRPVDHADLKEIGLVDILEVHNLFADGRGHRFQADRPAVKALDDGAQIANIDII